MKQERWYEEWQRRRAEETAPPHFADRVMDAITAHEAARRQRSAWAAMLLVVRNSRLGRIGVCSLAGAVFLFRLLHVVALFVAQ